MMFGYFGLWYLLIIPLLIIPALFVLLGIYLVTGISFLDFLATLFHRGATLTCWHCQQETPADRKICLHCGEELQ